MKSEVRSLATAAAVSIVQPVASNNGAGLADSRTASEAQRSTRHRLVIEEAVGGAYVYKTLDRVTGEVISQLPREEVVRLKQDPRYAAGRLVDTRA